MLVSKLYRHPDKIRLGPWRGSVGSNEHFSKDKIGPGEKRGGFRTDGLDMEPAESDRTALRYEKYKKNVNDCWYIFGE